MKQKIIVVLAALLVLVSISTWADRPPPMPPEKAYDPPQREYEEETFDAVWILKKEHDVWDGEYIWFNITQKLLIKTERGAERFLDMDIHYDQTSDELTIQTASVKLESGEVLKPPEDGIVDISASRRPIYTSSRIRRIHWPSLEPEAVITLSYTIKHKPRIPGNFQSVFTFQDWMPIRKAEFSLETPSDMMMFLDWKAYQTNGIEELPLEFTSTGNTYYWTLAKSPGIISEYGMPALSAVAPTIQISTFTSWNEIGKWWWDRVLPMMKEIRPDILSKAREVSSKADNEYDKIAAVYHWLEQRMNYVALEFGEGGFIPYHPNEVYDRGYGDCKDGAVLLTAILRGMGIEEAYPALINTGGGIHPDVPTMWFNHAVTVLKLDKKKYGSKWLVLDTTAKTTKFGDMPVADQGRWMLVVGAGENGEPELVQSPLYPPEHNSWESQMEFLLRDDGSIEGTVSWKFTGAYESYIRWLMSALTTRELIGFFESYATLLLPGAEIEEDEEGNLQIRFSGNPRNLSDPHFQIQFSFTGECAEYFDEGSKAVFNVPAEDPLKGLIQKEWRYYPYVFSLPSKVVKEVSIIHKVDWTTEYLPQSWQASGYWGSMEIKYEIQSEYYRVIKRTVTQIMEHRWMPRRMYNSYVEALNKFALLVERPIIIRKIKE